MRKSNVQAFISNRTKGDTFCFLLVVLYAGFASVGHPLFFTGFPVPQVAVKLLFLLLFCCWLSYVAIAFLYFTDLCKIWLFEKSKVQPVTRSYSTGKLYLIFASILIACWSLWLIGFYPGTMSPDSFEQWKQAYGILKLNDAFPVIYAFIIRGLTTIWYSPAIIAIVQILFMAGIFSSFLVFLYKAGIPYKWLLVFAIITGIMPTNGIMVITIWKDIFFCVVVVWLTLVIAELLTQTYIFNRKITLICLSVSLLAVAILRHNGVMAALCCAAVLIVFAVKNKRKEILLPVACFLLAFFTYRKFILHTWLKVPPVPTGFQLTAPMHGMGSIIYYNQPLPASTMEEMQKLLPVEVWKSHYTPYSADEYMFQTDTPFIDNLSKVPTPKVVSMYANTLIHHPFLIVKDRLSGTELLWNAFQGQGSFNYSYHELIEENEFGFKHRENGLHKVLMGMLNFAGRALDPLVRRAGLYNILLMFLLLYVARQRKNYWIVFLPLLAVNVSLLFSMTYQAFRYVYYVPLLFGFVWLFTVSKFVTPVTDKTIKP
ncbi:hypothetical protein [Niastella caeni]|nr:hypothetical protein [Niastella caeni]